MISLTIFILIVVFLIMSRLYPAQQLLFESDVEQIVADLYEGELQSITEENGIYEVEWGTDHGLYVIYVDGYNGEIHDLLPVEDGREIDSGESLDHKDVVISLNDVREIVEQFIGDDVQIKAIDLDNVRNQAVYEVEIEQQTGIGQLQLDAISGEVLSYTFSEERTDSQDDDEPRMTFISIEEAKQIALSQVAGIVEDVDLEEHNGRYVYEVEVEEGEVEADVIIDAITGDVITIIWED